MVELPGPHELVLLLLVIAVLAATGLWPRVIRALRELRGERQQETAPSRSDVALACKMLGVARPRHGPTSRPPTPQRPRSTTRTKGATTTQCGH